MRKSALYDLASALHDAESEKEEVVDQSSGIDDYEYGAGDFVGKIVRTISSQCSAAILPAELFKPERFADRKSALHRFFRQT
jgi:hypothetical protein